MPRHRRVARGLVRTFQINQLFGGLTPLRGGRISHRRARGARRHVAAAHRRRRRVGGRGGDAARALRPRRRDDRADRPSSPTAGGACSRSPPPSPAGPRVLLLDEPAAGIPEAEREEILADRRRVAARRVGAAHRARHGPRVRLRRAHHRARSTAQCSPKARRGDRRRSARARRLPRGGRSVAEASAPSRASTAGYGAAVVIEERRLRARRGPGAGAAWAQRHRQDHADQHRRRPDHPLRRARPARRPRHRAR